MQSNRMQLKYMLSKQNAFQRHLKSRNAETIIFDPTMQQFPTRQLSFMGTEEEWGKEYKKTWTKPSSIKQDVVLSKNYKSYSEASMESQFSSLHDLETKVIDVEWINRPKWYSKWLKAYKKLFKKY